MYCYGTTGEAAKERLCVIMIKQGGPLGYAARRELGMVPLFCSAVSGVATLGGLKS